MSKKKVHSRLVPELRFPEFEGGDIDNIYKRYLFTDVFLFSTGKNIKQSEASPEFEIPCVRYGELYHMYNEVIYQVINKTNLDSSELRFSKGDEILLPSAGEDPLDIGSASALTLANVAIGRTINILRPLQENVYSQIYVSYYINEKLRRKISTLAKGSSISNVYNSDLRKLEILLPSLSEQQKITHTLTSIDNLIFTENEKLESLKAHKKGLLQQLFPAKGEKVPEVRFGEFSGDWEKDHLSNLIDGISPPKKYKSSQYLKIGTYPIIDQSKNKIAGWTDDKKALIDDGFPLIIFGDHTCILKIIEQPFAQGADGIKIFKGKQNIDNRFLYYALQLDPLIMKSYKRHFSILKEKLISYPKYNLEEQQKIAKCLSSLDDMITIQSQKIETLKEHKKGLMQQMFPNINEQK